MASSDISQAIGASAATGPLLAFAGGVAAASQAQAAAFVAAETGLTLSALPGIVNAAAPASSVGSLATGAAYHAADLTGSVTPAAAAPRIAEWTRSGNPGDAIVLSGANLGSNLRVFVYGQAAGGAAMLAEATVVQSESGDAVVTLPTGLPANGVYTLWAANSAGVGAGVLLNAPEVWWVGSDEAAPGQITSVYGRNLVAPGGKTPSVVLQMTDGAQAGRTIALNVVSSSGYRVDVRLPTDLPDGHYKVYLNNNGGGQASWSQTDAATLAVRAATGHDWAGLDHITINVASYGAVTGDGKDDSIAIQAAMSAARTMITSGGQIHEVTIQLAAGTYDISQPITLEDGVNLAGAGVGKTVIEPTAAFAAAKQTFMIWAGASTAAAGATGSRVGDLTIDTKGGAGYTGIYGRSSQHMTVENVDVEARNGDPFDIHASSYFTLADSRIVGRASFIGSANQVTIHDNAFYGTNQTGENIAGFGASDVALYNNTAQNLDPNPTASDWQTDASQGRFYVDQTHYGQPVNQFIGGNTTSNLAPFVEYENQGAATNAGEQILFEGAGETTRLALSGGLLKAATTTSLTLSKAVTLADDVGTGALLTVASGTGAGATTEITSYDAATATFHFADPLAVPLDATSTIIVSRAPDRIAIVGNTLDGRAQNVASSTVSASTGVEVYPGGARVAIDGNTFSDLRQAVSLWSFPSNKDDTAPAGSNALVGVNFFDIKNNTVTNSTVGIDFHQDPGGAADLAQPAAIVDAHQTIGTTIRNNDLSGVTGTSLGFETRQATSVDIAAANVASGNTLSGTGVAGGLGFDAGSSNLLVTGVGTAQADRLRVAESLQFQNAARYFGTAAEPAFQATFGADGTLALGTIRAVAGTVSGQAALVATGGAGDDVGFTSDSTDSRLQVLHGGDGNDILIGTAGANILAGDAGDDLLRAGVGTVLMTGGGGADTFVLNPSTPDAVGTVTDFSAAQGDRIVIEATLPAAIDPLAAGYLKLTADSTGTAVMYDADGGGNGFVRIGHVDGALAASSVSVGLAAPATTTGPVVTTPVVATAPLTTTPVVTSPSPTAPVASTTPAAATPAVTATVAATTVVTTPVTTAPVVTTPVVTTPVVSTTAVPSKPTTAAPVTTTAKPTTVAADVLGLKVSEDAYKGDAQFIVSVDGKQIGGTQTATTAHGNGQNQSFLLTGSFGAGDHSVGITFLNDLYGGTKATDRNLYVKSVSLNGSTTTTNAAQKSQGLASYKVTAPATNPNALVAGVQSLSVGSGGTLILDKDAAAGDAVTMTGSNATVQFTNASAFHGTLAGFGAGDTMDLRSVSFGGGISTSLALDAVAGGVVLTVSDGANRAALSLSGSYGAGNFKMGADGKGGTAISYVATHA